jgi:hypothetical protein
MSDDRLERDLQAWFQSHAEPEVPNALRRFLGDLPRSQTGTVRVGRPSPILAGATRRDLALVFVAAVSRWRWAPG